MLGLFFATLLGSDEEPVDEEQVQQWIRAAQVGNRGAARRLYTSHLARVYRSVRPLCASDEDAEDATQQAFADALTHLERYAPRPGKRFISWLVTLAFNRARKRGQRSRRLESQAPEELQRLQEAELGVPAEELLARRQALLAALEQLPERDRRIVCLRYGAELTAEEVEQVTGVSNTNIRKICERQRKALLERLAPPEAA